MANAHYLWVGYTVFFCTFVLVSYLRFHPERTVYDYLDMPLTLIAGFGLVCFAFDMAIVPAAFWRLYTPVFLFWEVTYNVWISVLLRQGQKWHKVTLPEILFAFIILVPVFIALLKLG